MVDTKNLKLVAIGNPLLDMQVRDGQALLDKYNLKPVSYTHLTLPTICSV